MSIEVRSPHNGEMVKVMPKDVGKAVKDSDGRVFYVMPKSDGSGYFAAITRAGAEKDEARSERADNRMAAHQEAARERDTSVKKGRIHSKPYRLYLVVAVVVILGAYFLLWDKIQTLLNG